MLLGCFAGVISFFWGVFSNWLGYICGVRFVSGVPKRETVARDVRRVSSAPRTPYGTHHQPNGVAVRCWMGTRRARFYSWGVFLNAINGGFGA